MNIYIYIYIYIYPILRPVFRSMLMPTLRLLYGFKVCVYIYIYIYNVTKTKKRNPKNRAEQKHRVLDNMCNKCLTWSCFSVSGASSARLDPARLGAKTPKP